MPRFRRGAFPALLAGLLVLLAGLGWLLGGWYLPGPLPRDEAFRVASGTSLSAVADQLAQQGAVRGATAFRLRMRLLGGKAPIKAGEFLLPKRASAARILAILQGSEVVRRFVLIPEGMPAVMVYDRLMANPVLTGRLAVPEEGSVLPDSYEIQPGEAREAVLARMQSAMRAAIAAEWAGRDPDLVVTTPAQAVVLASIVEKETGKAEERPLVAGLYANRLRKGIRLQADPTIIYPITRGKPLGRRIRQSEIHARNGYNTYAMAGLPQGPITNPGRAALHAVLHPADTDALYMVADGTGGHKFAATLAQHNANVQSWYAIRKARGEY
jgi:UPF0755 protein